MCAQAGHKTRRRATGTAAGCSRWRSRRNSNPLLTTTNTEGKVKDSSRGDKYSEQSTATQTPNYDNYATYTVEAGDFTYTAKQHLLFPWSKPANIAVGGQLKYAVEKDKLYLLDDDGKESSAKIIKKAVKGAQ